MSGTQLPNQVPQTAEKETYPHTAQQETFVRRTLIVSPQTALWVIITFELIQIIAGVPGIIVATPLIASILIIVQMLNVSDVLGDKMALEKTEN